MACNFTITFQGSAGDFVAKAKAKVEENNGTFDGDTSSGSFDVPTPIGHISGDYSISATSRSSLAAVLSRIISMGICKYER